MRFIEAHDHGKYDSYNGLNVGVDACDGWSYRLKRVVE